LTARTNGEETTVLKIAKNNSSIEKAGAGGSCRGDQTLSYPMERRGSVKGKTDAGHSSPEGGSMKLQQTGETGTISLVKRGNGATGSRKKKSTAPTLNNRRRVGRRHTKGRAGERRHRKTPEGFSYPRYLVRMLQKKGYYSTARKSAVGPQKSRLR